MNEIVPLAETWMDLETIIQREVCQKQKNKHHMLTHIGGIQKNGMDEPICKAEIDTNAEHKPMETKAGRRGWDELGDWD